MCFFLVYYVYTWFILISLSGQGYYLITYNKSKMVKTMLSNSKNIRKETFGCMYKPVIPLPVDVVRSAMVYLPNVNIELELSICLWDRLRSLKRRRRCIKVTRLRVGRTINNCLRRITLPCMRLRTFQRTHYSECSVVSKHVSLWIVSYIL